MLFKYPIVVLLSCLALTGCGASPKDLLQVWPSFLQDEARIALVIGNGDYPGADLDLESPVSDALKMTKALKEVGFDVIHYPNADQQQMENAFREFRNKLANTDPQRSRVGLFYYSGHGVESNGKTYLVAVDATTDVATGESKGFVSLASLYKEVNELNQAKQTTSVFILDNCRNNTFDKLQTSYRIGTDLIADKSVAKTMEGITKGLKRADDLATEGVNGDPKLLSEPDNSFTAYATSRENVAEDGKSRGENSPYTKRFLKWIREPIPLDKLVDNVSEEVKRDTNGKQRPTKYSAGGGDFYFSHSSAGSSGFH